MIRVCVLGNSHLGAIAKGWQLCDELHEVFTFTFFGAPAEKLRGLEVGDGRLYPRTPDLQRYLVASSHGLTDIKASEYDLFLITGGFGFYVATDVYNTHRMVEDAAPGYGLVSEAALNAAIRSGLRATLAPFLRARLASISSSPVIIITDPLPSTAIADSVQYRRRWIGGHLAQLHERYGRLLALESEVVAAPIYTQPEATVAAPCFTAPTYTMDDPVHGLTHMNSAFGAAVLRKMEPWLRRAASG